MFQFLPLWLLNLRYCGTLLLCALSIGLGFELLLLRDWARRSLICLAVYRILTVYWRHPYTAFFYLAIESESRHLGRVIPALSDMSSGYPIFPAGVEFAPLVYPWMPVLLAICFITVDVLFNAFVVWFLTLPSIKAQFSGKKKMNVVKNCISGDGNRQNNLVL